MDAVPTSMSRSRCSVSSPPGSLVARESSPTCSAAIPLNEAAPRKNVVCGVHTMKLRRVAVFCVALVALAACSSDNRKVLIVYSPHGKELLEYFEKGFEKARPDIDVQWVDMGSQEVLERVRAEKPNPQADV